MIKFFPLFLLLSCPLLSQESVSNADLSKKLDLILQKVGGLEERVSRLETENAEVKDEVKKVAKSAADAKKATQNISIPQNEKSKSSFLNRLRIDLKSEEVKSRGPWTKRETWTKVRKNLTRYQVRDLLGNPNTVKSSLNPRIDQVYHYYGDLNADGKEDKGYINFFRDRVVSYKSPFE